MKNVYAWLGGRKAFFVFLIILIWISTLFFDPDIFSKMIIPVLSFVAAYLGINTFQKFIDSEK